MSVQLLRDEDVTQVVGGLLDASATLVTNVPSVPIADGGGDVSSPVTFLGGKPVTVETPKGLLVIPIRAATI
ncbi:MAG TPA: hypothetical protein PLV31_01545 [Gammaproteobacteria bacterium]|nr:hypothetical protein [Gammaproteobacteria bacterium]HQZ87168.1 hypothetical protein [Gammaproteobacteria bacterium]HRA42358.1 hypothetical protein [Gammaproteobacteria bacterium]